MKRILYVATSSMAGIALVALTACASTMVPSNTRQSDSGVTSVIEASLEANRMIKEGQIDVQTREGIVYLNGVVDTREARREAVRVAERTEGVFSVQDNLTVGERTIGSRADDVLISSKVKSRLISDSDIKAGDIDVSSSQGVVTLIGRVSTYAIKTAAGLAARETTGVTGVNNQLLVGQVGR